MKTILTFLARLFRVPLVPRPDQQYIDAAKEHILHVAGQNEPGEWKQRQVRRALQNTFKTAKGRDLNLAIEIAVQECLG